MRLWVRTLIVVTSSLVWTYWTQLGGDSVEKCLMLPLEFSLLSLQKDYPSDYQSDEDAEHRVVCHHDVFACVKVVVKRVQLMRALQMF